jgi:hypothetical protein
MEPELTETELDVVDRVRDLRVFGWVWHDTDYLNMSRSPHINISGGTLPMLRSPHPSPHINILISPNLNIFSSPHRMK